VRILITGGLGYLGGRLAQLLAASGAHELRLASRAQRSDTPPVAGARIVRVDWSDEGSLAAACDGIDAIAHLAGMNALACARDPVAALECNGVGTARLLRAAAARQVRRVLCLSTAHVYGASLAGKVDEQTLPRPRHPYASSRLAAEHALRAATFGQALEGIVVRLSNAFGAPATADADCWALVCNDLARQAVTTQRAQLSSDGTQRRDFIPMSEACRALVHLLELPATAIGEGIFNVGGAFAPTLREMAGLIAGRAGLRLGVDVAVVTGAARDAVGAAPLEYCVSRLYDSGFKARPAAVTQELDQLVDYCTRHFTAAQAQ
jgi:UDP-glucose 4-epimerase